MEAAIRRVVTAPVIVAVLGTLSGVERASGWLWGGILMATVGVVLVIASRGVHLTLATVRGDLLVLLACCCWAAFTVGVWRVARGLNPVRVTAIATYGGTPMMHLDPSLPRHVVAN